MYIETLPIRAYKICHGSSSPDIPAPMMMTEFDGGEVEAVTNVKEVSSARAIPTAETFIFLQITESLVIVMGVGVVW